MRLHALLLSGITTLLVSACGFITPIGDLPPDRIDTDWAVQLYELDMLSYRPIEPGRPLWVESAAAPGGSLLVVPSRDRFVRAFDAVSGRKLWETETRGPVAAQPVALEEDLLVGSRDGRLYRLHQRNGRVVWKSELIGRGDIIEAPAVAGSLAFVTTTDNRITAVRMADGTFAWEKSRPHLGEFTITGQAGAAIWKDTVITGFSDGQVVALAQSDGATAWSVDLAGEAAEFVDVDSTPVLVGEMVVVSGYATGLHGLGADTGDVIWRVPGEGFGTVATLDGVVYAPRADGRLVAVDTRDGSVLWTTRIDKGLPRTPEVSRRYVLLPTERKLLLIDRGTGRVLLRYDDLVGFTGTPELAWGTLYAQANSGWLYALAIY